MNSPDSSTVKTAFDYLRLGLRYVASGFVSVIVMFLIDHDARQFSGAMFKDGFWIIVLIAAVIGVFTYAIHHAFFDKMFYAFSIMLYRGYHDIPQLIKDDIKLWKCNHEEKKGFLNRLFNLVRYGTNRKFIFYLKAQAYLRKTSHDARVTGLQNLLDEKLSLLMFLYGSIYSMVFITAFHGLILEKIRIPQKEIPFDFLHWFMIIIAVLLLCIAVGFDYRITAREMWLIENFPQKIKKSPIVNFNFIPPGDHGKIYGVSLAGSFNQWQEIPLLKGDIAWSCSVELLPGAYSYKYKVYVIKKEGIETRWQHDPAIATDNSPHSNNIVMVS